MKKIFIISIALLGIILGVNAKSANTPIGCWKLVRSTDSTYTSLPGNEMDTMLVEHIWDADSIILCPKGKGSIQYFSKKTVIHRTRDGYYDVYEQENLFVTDFTWKYVKGRVQFLTCSRDIIGHIVERMHDSLGTKYPSRYRNDIADDAEQFMIDLLPLLKLEYNPDTGQLSSRSMRLRLKRCHGKPQPITVFQQSLTI